MKIYNESKTEILENVDLEKGYLKEDKLVIRVVPAQEEVQEQFHYEYKDYTNDKGEVYGRDRIKVVDVPYQPAVEEHEETEDIQVYVPYTEEELLKRQKQELRNYRQKFFDVIDCAVWYDCLTDKEKQEVKEFRYALLDITETLEKPTIPACVLERIKED